MNVEYFRENLELISNCGVSLTDLEAALIENSLIILQNDNKLREIFFFGRINTTSLDGCYYYIAFGYRNDILKDRKFFYSLNAYEWVLMPQVKPKLLPIALQARTLLTGDPINVENVCMYPTFVDNNRGIKLPCPERVKRLKEEDRLACLVHMIMNESAIIPRGVLYRQVTRDVTYNPCFRGLNHSEAKESINFQLFRYPLNNRNFNLTKRENYNYQTDFFDTIDDVVPKNSFTRTINDRNVCIIKSLNWLGMSFVHKLNTAYQCFVYFGNGKKNLDISLIA